MSEVNNIKSGNNVWLAVAEESVTQSLNNIVKKRKPKVCQELQDATAAGLYASHSVEHSLQNLVTNMQGGHAQQPLQNLVTNMQGGHAQQNSIKHQQHLIKQMLTQQKTAFPVESAGEQTMAVKSITMAKKAEAASAGNQWVSAHDVRKDNAVASPMRVSDKGHFVQIVSPEGEQAETQVNDSQRFNLPVSGGDHDVRSGNDAPMETDTALTYLAADENFRTPFMHFSQPHQENVIKDLQTRKELTQTRMLSSTRTDQGADTLPKESVTSNRLTYTFSEWGRGHQVNVQLASQYGAPTVLQPSDPLVQHRLSDHRGHNHQGQPEWFFQDEEEQQSRRRPNYQDEEQG